MMNQVIEHYDLLIEEGIDPVHDPRPLQDHGRLRTEIEMAGRNKAVCGRG